MNQNIKHLHSLHKVIVNRPIMPVIQSFVFFDIETTGLPREERNQTKITECSFLAVSREDLEATAYGESPPGKALSFLLNPERPISRIVTQITGLSTRKLKKAPVFKQKVATIVSFLEELPKPVCLVAHNGHAFDYKILLAECKDAYASMPADLLCLDSLVGFRDLLKYSTLTHEDLQKKYNESKSMSSLGEDLISDDEDDRSDSIETDDDSESLPNISIPIKVTPDTCINVIHNYCKSPDTSTPKKVLTPNNSMNKKLDNCKSNEKKTPNSSMDKVGNNCKSTEKNPTEFTYKLPDLYKRLLNREASNAHRAEVDCLMLAECVAAMNGEFLPWADKHCKLLSTVTPLNRYYSRYGGNRWN